MEKEAKSKYANSVKEGIKGISRRRFLCNSVLAAAGWVATTAGGWVLRPEWANAATGPIKIGALLPISGSSASMGIGCWQMMQVWAKKVNDNGGVLGRPVELYIEDYGSEIPKAVQAARRLAQQRGVHMITGTFWSSTRIAVKKQITVRDKLPFFYPAEYEGGECTRNLFCTSNVPNHVANPLVSHLLKTGSKRFALLGSDYTFPRNFNKAYRKILEEKNIDIVFEEYYPMDQTSFASLIAKINNEKIDCVLSNVVGGWLSFYKSLFESGYYENGGRVGCHFMDESMYTFVPSKYIPGLISCMESYLHLDRPYNKMVKKAYYDMFPDTKAEPGYAPGSTWRGLQFYEQAIIKTNGDLRTEAITEALPGIKLKDSIGGPAEMVGNHCKFNIYVARNVGKTYEILDQYDMVDPRECV